MMLSHFPSRLPLGCIRFQPLYYTALYRGYVILQPWCFEHVNKGELLLCLFLLLAAEKDPERASIE